MANVVRTDVAQFPDSVRGHAVYGEANDKAMPITLSRSTLKCKAEASSALFFLSLISSSVVSAPSRNVCDFILNEGAAPYTLASVRSVKSVPWRPDQCVNMAIAQGDKVLLRPGFVCTAAVQMDDQSELSLQEITRPSVNSNHEAARPAKLLLDWRAFVASPLIGGALRDPSAGMQLRRARVAFVWRTATD